MSTLLSAQSFRVDTAFGTFFDSLSFTLKKGDRIGLAGRQRLRQKYPAEGAGRHAVSAAGTVSAGRALPDGARGATSPGCYLLATTLLDAVLAQLPASERDSLRWRAETLLASMGLTPQDMAAAIRHAERRTAHPPAAGAGADPRAGSAPAG